MAVEEYLLRLTGVVSGDGCNGGIDNRWIKVIKNYEVGGDSGEDDSIGSVGGVDSEGNGKEDRDVLERGEIKVYLSLPVPHQLSQFPLLFCYPLLTAQPAELSSTLNGRVLLMVSGDG